MKITSKLAEFNFNDNIFLDKLLIHNQGSNQLQLQTLFTLLEENLQVFLTIEEQLAITNGIFPLNMEYTN